MTHFLLALLVSLNTFIGVVGSDIVPSYSYDDFAQMTQMFDNYYDELPQDAFPIITNQKDVDQWVQEIIPYFSYEGVTDLSKDEGEYGGFRAPTSVSFQYYSNALENQHVLGTTNCFTDDVTLNARFINPKSPFYSRQDILSTLVHELTHAQGVCFDETSLGSEVSAQIITVEILSAMVNRGTKEALGPLIEELRYMSLTSAKYLAMRDGRENDFQHLLSVVADPYERATYAKSDRFWAKDRVQEYDILWNYNYVPMTMLMSGISQDCYYREMVPPDFEYAYLQMPAPCVANVELPSNQHAWERPLVIDDFQYVYNHLAELVGATP